MRVLDAEKSLTRLQHMVDVPHGVLIGHRAVRQVLDGEGAADLVNGRAYRNRLQLIRWRPARIGRNKGAVPRRVRQ